MVSMWWNHISKISNITLLSKTNTQTNTFDVFNTIKLHMFMSVHHPRMFKANLHALCLVQVKVTYK